MKYFTRQYLRVEVIFLIITIFVFLTIPFYTVFAIGMTPFGGMVMAIIPPAPPGYICPVNSYVIGAPSPAVITPMSPPNNLRPGQYVLGVHFGTLVPTCVGYLPAAPPLFGWSS